MGWSITQVARMSGVSARTLRHYDAIGLLAPAYVGTGGYRYYEREQLLRLQEVLLLRELGLGLAAVAQVLSGERDRGEALRCHHARLLAERDRLDRLARTVASTIASLGGEDMSAEDLFDGLAQRQAAYEEELVDRYGEGVRRGFAESRERTQGWTREDYLGAQRDGERVEARLLDVLRSGAAPDDPRTLDAVAEHHAGVARFWTPTAESYTGLGRLYVDDPRFRARYDALDPRLATWLRDAMAAYARERLT